MKRRSFLAMQAAALGTALFSGFPSLLQASGKPDIAVVQGDPAAATHKAVAMLGGMDCFVKTRQNPKTLGKSRLSGQFHVPDTRFLPLLCA